MKKIDKNGNITVKNITAYHIPSITLSRKIGGTVYLVSGRYAGKRTLPSKLLRLMENDREDRS